MSLRSDSIIDLPSDEEFGPFGRAAISMLDMLFPQMYRTILIVDPTFKEAGRANITPQFDRGEFFVLSSVEVADRTGKFSSDLRCFSAAQDLEASLDRYRFEHAILASKDLSILSAWAQAEYAIIAFRGTLLNEYDEWLRTMRAMNVVRKIV